ncbi:MAG TPA: hypothetical protein VIV11_17435, partial [Kofleriaceae bacterium]
ETPPLAPPSASVAIAPPAAKPDRYPSNFAERPLQLPSGATELGVSEEFRTYVSAIADEMGNVRFERNGFAEDRVFEVGLTHAFGPLQVEGHLGRNSSVHLAFDTHAMPSQVFVTAVFGPFYSDNRYAHHQAAGVRHKVVLVPSRLALVGAATAVLNERRDVDSASMTETEGYSLSAGAGAAAHVQLWWRFALSTGLNGSIPIAHSEPYNPVAAINVGVYTYLALRKWDFYVGGNLFDVTRGHPSTFFTFGLNKRWGL